MKDMFFVYTCKTPGWKRWKPKVEKNGNIFSILIWGSVNIFCKRPAILGFASHSIPVTSAGEVRKQQRKILKNEWVWWCSRMTLFMEAEIWISYNFHKSHNILLIFPTIKNCRNQSYPSLC
jgi:hypothetical protein